MRAVDGDWIDLSDTLAEHPQIALQLGNLVRNGFTNGGILFNGYNIAIRCLLDGEHRVSLSGETLPANACLERHKAVCGANYIDVLPELPICLSDNHGPSGHGLTVAIPIEMLAAMERTNLDAAGIKEFSWVLDGIESNEMALLYELSLLTVDADLPVWEFLERVDAWDIHALNALQRLATHEEYFLEITSYFEQQGGLSDEQIPMLFALQHMLSREKLTPYRSDIMKVMLDTEQTTTIRRVIDLPLTGEFTLSVIMPSASGIPSFSLNSLYGYGLDGLAPENPMNAMRHLEESVVLLEEFMGTPFPHNYAFMLIAEFLGYSFGVGGYYVGNGLIYASIDHKDTIAHETAHIYWDFPSVWITEGGALNFEDVFENSPFPEYNYACSVADNVIIDNIAALEQLEDELGWVQVFESGCYRRLGRLLFAELRQSLVDAAFRRGFRNLYLALRDKTYESACADEYRTGCYLREAFADGATAEQIAVIDDIVSRRYYGRE